MNIEDKIRVSMPTMVPCLDDDVDITAIGRELNGYVQGLACRINLEDIDDWRILLLVISRATSGIGVYKRSRRYPSDKEYEMSVSISIPDDEQASYGLAKVKDGFYYPLNDKNFYILQPQFQNYHSLYEYILESSKRAIDVAFTQGITCNGKKIKFQKYEEGE